MAINWFGNGMRKRNWFLSQVLIDDFMSVSPFIKQYRRPPDNRVRPGGGGGEIA